MSRLIEHAVELLPARILLCSGAVFYTGQQAFSGKQPLYILGLNPGGNPESQANETIGRHLQNHWQRSAPWSEYADERWAGKEPGAHQNAATGFTYVG